MATKKIIAICQSGGEFVTNPDGSLSYNGGEAYAVDLDQQTKLSDFKQELSEIFDFSVRGLLVKYFLPGNKKNLITISRDKDLKRMVNFFGDSDQVELFIVAEEAVARNLLDVPASRSSWTPPVSEAAVTPVAPVHLVCRDDPIIMDVPIESTPGGPLSVSNDNEHRKAAMQWLNMITGVGQRFSSFSEFLEALRKYSMAHGFAYTYKKKDNNRVTVTCKSEGCPWRINVSRLPTTELICIKKMSMHACEGSSRKPSYRVTRRWAEGIIKEKLKVHPNYKPKDLASDINREYGVQLTYSRVRRAKESAREQLQGSYKEAYSQLPFFCDKIMETNPGSVATFSTKEDSSFHRLFVSFHGSISGFQQGCRPLLFLNSTPLNSKYPGMVLAATAADGDDGVFPVAFSVVDAENDENWHWFLLELKSAVSTSRQITFVADFRKGLRESITEIFGKECYHSYCLHYLVEKLDEDLKGKFSYEARRLMVQDIYAAAHEPKLEGFQRCLENIKAISPDAYNWVIQSEPHHWANAFFGGARYNHMTSSFGQMFYSWAAEANEFPITKLVDVVRGKIMELIYKRRVDSKQWVTRLTPSMEEKLQEETSKARALLVSVSHGSTFEVRGESVDIVDIDRWECSCKGWELTGLPCLHAIAVFECLGRSPYDYCFRYFTAESYRLTYAESIHPVPNIEMPLDGELTQVAVTVTPPPTKRLPGRPKLKQIEAIKMKQIGSMDIIKRELKCSKCKVYGHTKRKCIVNSELTLE